MYVMKVKEGGYLTQVEDVAFEDRIFVKEVTSASPIDNFRDATPEEITEKEEREKAEEEARIAWEKAEAERIAREEAEERLYEEQRRRDEELAEANQKEMERKIQEEI